MNTRQLHHFLALISEGSLSAAAAKVHLSQPALSRSIRALEDSLGVPLFDRNERRLQPTAYAGAFEERARRIVFEEKEAVRTLEYMQAGDIGALSFGMGSSLASHLLKPMVRRLLDTSPRLKLRIAIETSDRLMQSLLNEKLDFFIGDIRTAAHHPDTTVDPIYLCTFGWYGRSGHSLANRQAVTIEDLAGFSWVVGGFLEESLTRRLMEIYGLHEPFLDHFAVVTNDLPTAEDLVSHSEAIIASTDLAMVAATRAGKVKRLKVTPPLDMDMTLGIVYLTGRTLIPAATQMFTLVREYLASAAAEIEASLIPN